VPRRVVVLDANLLVPIVACDFLLTAADHGLFEPLVSASILEEVERNLIELRPDIDPDRLRRRVGYMRTALADNIIDTEPRPSEPAAINAKDRHVALAALGGHADLVATNDADLRVQIGPGKFAFGAVSGDDFVAELWASSPAEVALVIDSLIAKRRTPPIMPERMAEQLRVHFPIAANAWLESLNREM